MVHLEPWVSYLGFWPRAWHDQDVYEVSLFIYAIIITVIAVIVMANLAKLAERTAPPKAA